MKWFLVGAAVAGAYALGHWHGIKWGREAQIFEDREAQLRNGDVAFRVGAR